MAPLLEEEKYFAEVEARVGLQPVAYLVNWLRCHVNETEDRLLQTHAHERYFRERFPQHYQGFLAQFKAADKLERQLSAVRPAVARQQALRATICGRWPGWDWKIPRQKTPPFWSERTLKQLRFVALRTPDWELLMPELANIASARLRSTNGGGLRATEHLEPHDVDELRAACERGSVDGVRWKEDEAAGRGDLRQQGPPPRHRRPPVRSLGEHYRVRRRSRSFERGRGMPPHQPPPSHTSTPTISSSPLFPASPVPAPLSRRNMAPKPRTLGEKFLRACTKKEKEDRAAILACQDLARLPALQQQHQAAVAALERCQHAVQALPDHWVE